MKAISLSVLESDYEAFQEAAAREGLPVARLIREAMALYRVEHLAKRTHLHDLPVLVGHRLTTDLPSRDEVYDEIFGTDDEDAP